MQLCDYFVPLLSYLCRLVNNLETEQPAFVEVKGHVDQLLEESAACLANGVSRTDFEQARFAVCAWADEAILNSAWLHKSQWLDAQLQRVHFGTTQAGEEFYVQMAALAPEQRAVREVFYLCLSLGFAGRYCHPGDRHYLEQLRSSQLRLVQQGPVLDLADPECRLFPEALPTAVPEQKPRRRFPGTLGIGVACVTAPLLLFALLYLVFSFLLNGLSGSIVQAVGT
jgi:type VI secretion system protein ImpK